MVSEAFRLGLGNKKSYLKKLQALCGRHAFVQCVFRMLGEVQFCFYLLPN